MVNIDATLCQYLFNFTVAQLVGKIVTNGLEYDLGRNPNIVGRTSKDEKVSANDNEAIPRKRARLDSQGTYSIL